jgi:predicted Zn-dependent peptidase
MKYYQMFKRFLFAVLSICAGYSLSSLLAQEAAPSKYIVLDNGLQIFLLEKHSVPLINIAAAVNAGIKDETEETNGLVHLLEHYLLFHSTEYRSGREMNLNLRRHGAYFNAHTGHDLSIFELSLPSEHADFGLKSLKEILFQIKLDQKELDQEKEVILEELSQVQDDPLRYATALAYQNIFPNHPYQKPVYGRKEVIAAATADDLRAFYKKFFVPSNAALAIVGDFALKEVEDLVRAVFQDLSGEKMVPAKFEIAPLLGKTVEVELPLDVQRGYLIIGFTGPDYSSLDQYALDVMTEIIGRGINPMLNPILRGRRDLVETLFMSSATHKYGGAILITLTLDPKNIGAAKRETINFMRKARDQNFSQKDYFGEEQMYAFDYLESAKNQIKLNDCRARQKGLDIALALAIHMILQGGEESRNFWENIQKVDSTELRRVAAKYFSRGDYAVVAIVPQRKK